MEMRPFLGIDLTEDKKNEQLNGEEFIIERVSSDMSETLSRSVEDAVDAVEGAKLPLAARIVHWVCGLVGAVTAIGLLKAVTGEDGITLAEAYQNAPWLFWITVACLLVWLILTLLSHQKEKTVTESSKSSHAFSRLDTVTDNIFDELEVPSDTRAVDILSFNYKIKDGIPKAHEKGLDITPYNNFEFRAFTDSENLYLADLEGKYCFPLSSFCAIHTVNKRISVPDWNKETEPNKGIYKHTN
ncbi:MAG: hypothetical protein ACI4F7_01170 [Acutalibacteraceae bacterium]